VCKKVELSVLDCRSKGMLRVVTMVNADMAGNTEVIVITSSARNKILLGEFSNTRVASTSRCSNLWFGCDQSCLGLGEEGLWFWRNGLSGAVNNLTILDETFDQPVLIIAADHTIVDTCPAKIVIAIVAGAAVIMLIWDR
jgi:hypothetical protein